MLLAKDIMVANFMLAKDANGKIQPTTYIGGSRGHARHTPRTTFLCFHIHFHQKVPGSGVHAP